MESAQYLDSVVKLCWQSPQYSWPHGIPEMAHLRKNGIMFHLTPPSLGNRTNVQLAWILTPLRIPAPVPDTHSSAADRNELRLIYSPCLGQSTESLLLLLLHLSLSILHSGPHQHTIELSQWRRVVFVHSAPALLRNSASERVPILELLMLPFMHWLFINNIFW